MELSYRTLFGYGFGHVLNDLCGAMWFTYLLIYLHKVWHFSNKLAGIVLLIGQAADGLSIPFFGKQVDRTDDTAFCIRYGRRKTWHLFSSICVMCAFPFIFSECIVCGNSSTTFGHAFYLAPIVAIFQFGWAATQVSHLSMIPSITQDVNDRTLLNSIRYAFTVFSNITVYGVTWLILGLDSTGGSHSMIGPEDAGSFRLIVFIIIPIGVVFAVLYHLLVKENVQAPIILTNSEDSIPHRRMSWSDWFKEPQFYLISVQYMSTRLFCNLTQAYVPIYLQDSLHLPEESVAYIPLVMYIFGFLSTLVMEPVNKLLGRMKTYIIGALIGFIGCGWVWLGEGAVYINYLIYIVAALIGSGGATMLVTSLAITADLIGPNVESSAFVYAAMSFTDKLSNGLVVMLIQSYAPCSDNPNCCSLCSPYYRAVIAFVGCGPTILGLLITFTLLPMKVGRRYRNRIPEHAPINLEPTGYGAIGNGTSPDHTSIKSERNSCGINGIGISPEDTSNYSESPNCNTIRNSSENMSISSENNSCNTIIKVASPTHSLIKPAFPVYSSINSENTSNGTDKTNYDNIRNRKSPRQT